MAKHYITFGQGHTHHIEGKVLHPNVVARFDAETPKKGRERAFELFGSKFCFEYTKADWNEEDMKFYPDGYIDIS